MPRLAVFRNQCLALFLVIFCHAAL
jgi:hypothetical protein